MITVKTSIPEVIIFEPVVFEDARGFFMESYRESWFKELGLEVSFVQSNHSKSQQGVLRGLHYQNPFPQGKLVRVTKGEVFDVAVDLRKNSTTFGHHVSTILSEKNKRLFWIPEGFAHGFLVLSREVEFQYSCTNYYAPEYENSIMWNDPTLNINWPIKGMDILLSDKDKKAKAFVHHDAISLL